MAAHSHTAGFDAAHWTAYMGQWSAEGIPNEMSTPRYLRTEGENSRQPQSALAIPSGVDFSKPLNTSEPDSSSYLFPTSEEQRALTVLKDYPNHLLARWFDLARGQPAGLSHNFTASQSLPLKTEFTPPLVRPIRADLKSTRADLRYNELQAYPLSGAASRAHSFEQPQQPLFSLSQSSTPSRILASPSNCDFSTANMGATSLPEGSCPCPSSPVQIFRRRKTGPRSTKDETSLSASWRSLRSLSDHCTPAQSPTRSRSRQTESTIYSCTFCNSQSTFRSKHEWKRHERSHVPQVEYTCMPMGAILVMGDHLVCAICGMEDPRADHLVEHKMHLCLHKSVTDRTYFRKDKFAKHLQVHGLGIDSPQVANWSQQLPERALGCGFCVSYFDTFEERSQHVADHFEQGLRKESWTQSTVILSLLSQPSVSSHWLFLQSSANNSISSKSMILWPESSSTDVLQRRLENCSEDGRDLAIAAYNLSSLCLGGTAGTNFDHNIGAVGYPHASSSLFDLI